MARMSIEELLRGETRFGMFTVLGEGEPIITKSHPLRCAKVRCDCGNIRHVQPAKLRSGKHLSCGCMNGELSRHRFTKHGRSGTPEYSSWKSMHERCYNPKNRAYHRYGGRGIEVCPQWHGLEGLQQFLSDMGDRPQGTTIDRINNDRGYWPDNCRWATPKEQSANISTNRMMTFGGITKIAGQWADDQGIPRQTFYQRLAKGWSDERAITEPLQENERLVEIEGEEVTLAEAARRSGVPDSRLRYRLNQGVPLERALDATPIEIGHKGEKNPSAKLTQKDVDYIRSSPEMGITLARRFGISNTTVSNIRKHRIWK